MIVASMYTNLIPAGATPGKHAQVRVSVGDDSIHVPWDPSYDAETNHSTAAEVFASMYLGMPNARTDQAVKLGRGTWRVTVIDED